MDPPGIHAGHMGGTTFGGASPGGGPLGVPSPGGGAAGGRYSGNKNKGQQQVGPEGLLPAVIEVATPSTAPVVIEGVVAAEVFAEGSGAIAVGGAGLLASPLTLLLVPLALGSLTFVVPDAEKYLPCAEDRTICWEEDENKIKTRANLDTSAIIAATQVANPALMIAVNMYRADKQAVVTSSALNEFLNGNIKYAGPMEQALVRVFFLRVLEIPDDPSDRVKALPMNTKSQLKNMTLADRNIFGTADKLGIVTITGDLNAVAWAMRNGVILAVWPHSPSRYAGK